MEFKEMGLSKALINAIDKMEYKEATPIQNRCIPLILEGKDIVGIAQTGTGKTAAFALPILEKLISNNKADDKIKVLVLSPTRELALQTRDSFRDYSIETGFKTSVILGGVNEYPQIKTLKKGVDILVATPGRLLDLIERKYAKLDNIKYLVLDEADTMLDMGFIKDIRKIIGMIPNNRQTLLFSATMPKEIQALTKEFMVNPYNVKVESNVTADNIEQLVYYIDKSRKFDLLLKLLDDKEKKSTLIFTRTKYGANKLEDQLNEFGIKTSVIHGNKSQSNRVKALQDFKTGRNNIMIATDIAARGIDINKLERVINYDMPEQAELYVHRIGRTARAGNSGISISLCSKDEFSKLLSVEKLINCKLIEVQCEYSISMPKSNLPKANFSNKKNNNKTNNNKKKNYQNQFNGNQKNEYFQKENDKSKEKSKRNYSEKDNNKNNNKFKTNNKNSFKKTNRHHDNQNNKRFNNNFKNNQNKSRRSKQY